MGVSVHFQDKEVHDGLICRQDAEIRLLEIMKKCITNKIKCDRDYATAVSSVAYQGQKFDRLDDIKNSNVLRAWKITMEELENLGKLYKSNADIIEKEMLEKISNICSEKRKAKRHYQDEYNRLCQDFYNLSEEVARKRSDYCKHLELYRLMRSRFEEHYVKSGRGGRKLEEVREKYQRACRKLHLVHNEYVLLIADAQESQKDFNTVLLPCLLRQQQTVLQDFIVTWQNALRDLVNCWHVSSTQITDYCERIKNAVNYIKPFEEYKLISEKQNGVLSSTDSTDFVFDCNLVEDTTGRLQPDQLAVDNLTVEWVRNKMSDLETTLKECQCNISTTETVRHNAQDSNTTTTTTTTSDDLSVHELRSKERKLNRQIEVIRNALTEIGCEELPSGCDIPSLENSFEHGDDTPQLNRISLKRSSLSALVQNNNNNNNMSSPPSSIVDMLWKPFRRKSAPNSPVLSSRATPSNDSVFEQQSSGVCVNNNTTTTTQHQHSTTINNNTNCISSSSNSRSSSSGSNNSSSSNCSVDCDVSSSNNAITMRTVIVSIESSPPSLTQVSNVNSNHSKQSAISSSSPAEMLCATNMSTLGSSTKSLIDEEWFHGVLPREEVVRLLTKEGDFLVRETTRNDETQAVLSVCWGGHKHFIVQTTSEGEYRFEGPAFPTIQELITYQFQSGLPVTSRSGAILRYPILRERWELNNDDVYLIQKVGRGNFGDVYKARLKTTSQEVAVKTCRVTVPEEHKKKFLQEGRILKQYDHPNVVKLIGICVQKQPIMIVMELVAGGSLLTFLRNNKAILTQIQMLFMCRDAAAGMKYLESKNCIHRDLAARNCLVGKNNIVKISDFGMSREEEEYIVSDGMKQIPIKWTAPEALNFGKYTSLCDIWSYGVLAWEIFSKGGTPYSGLSNSKAREKIDSGYRMPAPEGTPDEMYRLMLKCWEYQPENRPHFDQIYNTMDAIINTYE